MAVHVGAESEQGIVHIPSNAYLIINSRVFPLEQAEITIGRNLDNDLVINDPSVSRVHARLVAIEGRFEVHDLNSTNGTTLNGKPVERQTLHSGDTITFAEIPTVYIEYTREEMDRTRDRTSFPISGGERGTPE